jgi:hypothetical protein
MIGVNDDRFRRALRAFSDKCARSSDAHADPESGICAPGQLPFYFGAKGCLVNLANLGKD